ncbi:PAS domain-containing protein [Pseudomonas aeruginosa]|nr:PAS domain-containing protein [Pseudomonas aeruginosa]MDW0133085.1 PAS domain-containing protein [Pseudomonas aeruginosa]
MPQQPALEHGIRQRWLSGADRLFPEQLIDSQSLTFNSLIHPDDREDVWRAVQLGVDELQVFSIEYRLLCSDGSEKRVLERGCGIYSDAGDPLGLEGVVLERL